MGLENRFSSDDYQILDFSGRELAGQWVPIAGTYLQLLPESTDPIIISLGSGGSGPPKQMQLLPGGHLELRDMNRPFSGFYVHLQSDPDFGVSRVLVANTGIQLQPAPASIDSITTVGTVGRIGKMPADVPIDLRNFLIGGAFIDGKSFRGNNQWHSNQSSNADRITWVNLPADNARATDPIHNIELRITLPFEGMRPGDYIYLRDLSVLFGPWK